METDTHFRSLLNVSFGVHSCYAALVREHKAMNEVFVHQ